MLNDIYESGGSFLKAADLIVDGQKTKPVVEIESAEVRENTYDGVTKKQIVLSFVGKEKVLGLNFTNAQRIAELSGTEDHNEWVGLRIKLYVDQAKLQNGTTVPCIRIFPDLPERAQAVGGRTDVQAPPAYTGPATRSDSKDDDIPF